jgi:hypothetical protein
MVILELSEKFRTMKPYFTIPVTLANSDATVIIRFATFIKFFLMLFLVHICLFSFGQIKSPQCIDVALKNTVKGGNLNCKYAIGDTVVFTVKVYREDDNEILSDTIIVQGQESPNLKFISYKGSRGTYDKPNRLWTFKGLGLNDTLSTEVKFVIIPVEGFEGGLICSEVWVKYMKNCDIDSHAGDKNTAEDDYDRTCISIPIRICRNKSEIAQLIAPDGYSTYQWYLEGQLIDGANSKIYETTQKGNYSVQVDGNKCPTPNCCPIIVEDFCPCISDICIPYKIDKKNLK